MRATQNVTFCYAISHRVLEPWIFIIRNKGLKAFCFRPEACLPYGQGLPALTQDHRAVEGGPLAARCGLNEP